MTCDQERRIRRRSPGEAPQAGKIGRVVLAISVEGRDPGAACCPDARSNCSTLSSIFRVLQQSHPRHAALDPQNLSGRCISAAIIDVDDFILDETLKRSMDLAG